jgi:hypothetical protein
MSTYKIKYGIFPEEIHTAFKKIEGATYYVEAVSLVQAQLLFRGYVQTAYTKDVCVEISYIEKCSFW